MSISLETCGDIIKIEDNLPAYPLSDKLIDRMVKKYCEIVISALGEIMAIPRKGDCGGTPRVGKVGDPKPGRGGRRRNGRRRTSRGS